MAKERQVQGGEEKVVQTSAQAGKVRDQIAEAAGVSHDTVQRVKKIKAEAAPEVVEAVRKGEISVNKAYQTVAKPKVFKESLRNL